MPIRLYPLFYACLLFSFSASAAIQSVRVHNDTTRTVYIHQGGYAPSQAIEAGRWASFPFPFTVVAPYSKRKIKSSLLVATAGGRWKTTSNGFTYLDKPDLSVCLDYSLKKYKSTSGKRVWTIKSPFGRQKGCEVKGFKQLWWQSKS